MSQEMVYRKNCEGYLDSSNTYDRFYSMEMLVEGIERIIENEYQYGTEERAKILEFVKQCLGTYQIEEKNKRTNKNFSKYVNYVKEYIHLHYQEDISFSKLAKNLHLSRNYLSNLFKKEMGDNFINYLVRYRIRKAMEFIKEGNLTICQISEKVGFNDPAYFSRVFKNITGLSPTDYQKLAVNRKR